MHFTLYFTPTVDGKLAAKIPEDRQHEGLGDSIQANIAGMRRRVGSRAAIRTTLRGGQGPVLDRTAEHLGVSDEGVILLRRLFKECIRSVERDKIRWGSSEMPPKTKSVAWCRVV